MRPYAKTTAFAATLGLALFASSSATTRADPADTLTELRNELNTCLRGAKSGEVVDITIVFSLKRDGGLLGKPTIRYSKMPDSPDAQRRVADAVAKALQGCLPLSITDRFGGAIAGHPLAIRIRTGTARESNI